MPSCGVSWSHLPQVFISADQQSPPASSLCLCSKASHHLHTHSQLTQVQQASALLPASHHKTSTCCSPSQRQGGGVSSTCLMNHVAEQMVGTRPCCMNCLHETEPPPTASRLLIRNVAAHAGVHVPRLAAGSPALRHQRACTHIISFKARHRQCRYPCELQQQLQVCQVHSKLRWWLAPGCFVVRQQLTPARIRSIPTSTTSCCAGAGTTADAQYTQEGKHIGHAPTAGSMQMPAAPVKQVQADT